MSRRSAPAGLGPSPSPAPLCTTARRNGPLFFLFAPSKHTIRSPAAATSVILSANGIQARVPTTQGYRLLSALHGPPARPIPSLIAPQCQAAGGAHRLRNSLPLVATALRSNGMETPPTTLGRGNPSEESLPGAVGVPPTDSHLPAPPLTPPPALPLWLRCLPRAPRPRRLLRVLSLPLLCSLPPPGPSANSGLENRIRDRTPATKTSVAPIIK